LDATVVSGHITGLVGPDGAGKTTLLRLIAGLLRPDQGSLTVCGLDPSTKPVDVHRRIAYMPQRFGLYDDLTVLENLRLYADLRSVSGAERQAAFERLLTFTDLTRFIGRPAGKLSGGMKQKLGLACALIRPPQLLLLDEPSVGVDPISRRELWRMVGTLVSQGIGVIWSTAYLDEAERCADVLLLNEGLLIFRGPPHNLTRQAEGRTFMVHTTGAERRAVLVRALRRAEVADGLIQGSAVRLVINPGAVAPTQADLELSPQTEIEPVPPLFEDAFISMIGGAPKRVDDPGRPPRSPPAAAGPVVDVQDLTRRFGSFIAADGISFQVQRGEIFGLLGPNGAGKSTTFKMLCGLLRPTSGRAHVAGVDLATAPGAVRARLGYMAQKFSLYGDLSVEQNISFFAGIYGLDPASRQDATHRVVETFGLAPYLSTPSRLLPLGFKQRLALACAILHDPPLLFLDEPTSGVDPRTRREFWGRINLMVTRGVTVLVTTHFLDEAEYCDRIALIYNGRIIAEGSPDQLKERVRSETVLEPSLEEAFIALVEHDQRRSAV